LLVSAAVAAKTVDEYVAEAQGHQEAGELEQADAIMQQATKEHPESATAYAYLGLYRGMQAGATDDYMAAGRLSQESFGYLNKAVELDPENLHARLYRGLMGVNVPEFFGVLDLGIKDLEFVAAAYERAPDAIPVDLAVTAHQMLGAGYLKKKDKAGAKAAYEKVIELAPASEHAKAAEASIARLTPKPEVKGEFEGLPVEEIQARLRSDPENVEMLVALAQAHMDAGGYAEAEEVLRKAIEIDPTYAEAYKKLALALSLPLEEGNIYDERIHDDTEWATKIVFEVMEALDKAVELAPDDIEARFYNGQMAVSFPFFAGKLDQGLEYLQMVLDSDAPENLKAEAAYWLGFGYQKKGMTYWIKTVSEYSDEEAARMAFAGMRPALKRFDPADYKRPVIVVDFLLGFRDELPPQVAVWVETATGEFIRTLYVSGFSGFAREVQVVLPVWAATSKFADADAVTGASIDVGEHIYSWDLKDIVGNPVDPGRYVVKVETMHWPSMKYQMVEGAVTVGDAEDRIVVEEGDFIPYLEVIYLP
jgi:tetratricopeptide (TPR) repeat protein